MTFLTLFAQLTIVIVIFFVATKTVAGQFDFVLNGIFVTGKAIQPIVSSIQGIVSLVVMIEIPHQPIDRSVTQLALLGQLALVHIILFMAGIAHDFLVLVFARGVAIFTGEQGMGTQQRKLGKIMIEDHFLEPVFLIMTLGAIVAFLAFVYIVKPMTTGTFCRSFFIEQVTFMARVALQLLMLAF